MGFKPKAKVKVTLFTCKRCHKRYSNPVKHICKLKFNTTDSTKIRRKYS